MKKKLLLFVSIILFSFSATSLANNNNSIVNTNAYVYSDNYGEKFTFIEDGITFSVFKNGEFDFYINPRNGLYANIDLNTVSISYNAGFDYNAYVQYDDYGAIVQIENVPIYYDHYGRVDRVGDIRINYYNNRLVRIGGLKVYYNPYGYYSHYSGYINSYNRYYTYYPYNSFFIRPYYNNCIVSYNPYRYYYKPVRYNYYSNRSFYNKNYYKNNSKSKTYRKIDARVSRTNSNRNYQNRSTNNSHIVRNDNRVRSQKTKLPNNRSHNIRSNTSVKNQVIGKKMQSQSKRTLHTNSRVSQNATKNRLSTSSKRVAVSRNTSVKRTNNKEVSNRVSVKNTKVNKTPQKRNTQNVTSKDNNYRLTKSKRLKSNNTISKRANLPSNNRNKRKSS